MSDQTVIDATDLELTVEIVARGPRRSGKSHQMTDILARLLDLGFEVVSMDQESSIERTVMVRKGLAP